MIAVGNIMGGNNAKPESDIDLFIITEKKKVWLTRFFCVAVTKLFGLRPRDDKTRDTICLSFFASEVGMGLKELMLEATAAQSPRKDCAGTNPSSPLYQGSKISAGLPSAMIKKAIISSDNEVLALCATGYVLRDIYFIYWLACLEPIFDQGGVYERFIASNSWIYEALPNWQSFVGTHWRDAGRSWSFFYHDIVDLFMGGLEKNFRNWQIKRLPAPIREIMNQDTRVVATDDVLKFHVNDRREYYLDLYLKKLKELLK
jgi:hypothetical protein